MKLFFKRVLLCGILTFFVFCMPAIIMAQGGPGGPGNPACDPDCNCYPDGTPCPIDSGVLILIFIGVAYGIKKYNDTKTSSATFYNADSD